MTSIAQEQERVAPVERAVFVTDDDRRSRIARRMALAALAVATLWIAALAVGMLGLGRLPGLSLPVPAVGGKAKQHEQRPASQPLVGKRSIERSVPAIGLDRTAVARASTSRPTTTPQARAKARSSARARTARARGRTSAPVTTPAPPQAHAAPRVARGLERRGLTAPRGQTQKASATTKTAPGQTKTPKGQAKQTDATQPAPPPAPPGQQKPDKPPAKA